MLAIGARRGFSCGFKAQSANARTFTEAREASVVAHQPASKVWLTATEGILHVRRRPLIAGRVVPVELRTLIILAKRRLLTSAQTRPREHTQSECEANGSLPMAGG